MQRFANFVERNFEFSSPSSISLLQKYRNSIYPKELHNFQLQHLLYMKLSLCLLILFFAGCKSIDKKPSESIVARGQMPAITRDKENDLHLTYGSGDSIMYASSIDGGSTFTSSSLIAVVPKLAASHTRGPQIAATSAGLVLTACDVFGNIYSFVKPTAATWRESARVNDVDTVAKENLMALSADGNLAFAVWLDLRDKHNKIFGSGSTDGGITWSKNIMIYASPDTTVCECCKPSVVVNGNNVNIMFRNWLDGNRDLYLIQSSDGGNSFGVAKKLGKGSWPLKGCPMDGGSLTVTDNDVQTVWNRKGKIYTAVPGKEETEIGEGRGCTMETLDGKNVYAWVINGEVVLLKPGGVKEVLGKGQSPVLKAIDDNHLICVWENEKNIHKVVVKL